MTKIKDLPRSNKSTRSDLLTILQNGQTKTISKKDLLQELEKSVERVANQIKSVLNNAKTDSEKNIAEQKYKILQEENVSILKDAKVKAAEVDTKTVKAQIKEGGDFIESSFRTTGFMCIKRTVIEKMIEHYTDLNMYY